MVDSIVKLVRYFLKTWCILRLHMYSECSSQVKLSSSLESIIGKCNEKISPPFFSVASGALNNACLLITLLTTIYPPQLFPVIARMYIQSSKLLKLKKYSREKSFLMT